MTWILAIAGRVAAITAVIVALGAIAASDAAADEPLERSCQGWPRVEAVVRAALPTATVVRCPKRGAEFEIVHNTSVPLPIDVVEVQAVLRDGRIATLAVVPDNAELKQDARVQSISYRHSDLTGSSGGGMALLFWLFALASVAGAVFVITRRNLIAAVMGMVGSFLGIAAIYMMLYAQFLAVIQMLVYAGAIMVLFVFVVMILNRPEDEPVAPSGRVGQAIGGLAILYLIYRLCVMPAHVEPANPDIAMNAPAPLPEQCVQWRRDDSVPRRPGEPPPQVCERFSRPDWGSIAAVGTDLFGAGLFPFEAISILLLVAVVGAIAIARPLRPDGDAEADTDADAGHSEGRAG